MKLTTKQQAVLNALEHHGRWYAGCGWVWDNKSGTRKILDALVKKGLVETDGRNYTAKP